MDFVGVWLAGYTHPARMAEGLRRKPAPHWGFYGQTLRAALDSLLLYLPLALQGLAPPTPSYVGFLPTEHYYWHLIWITPLVFSAQWLLSSGFIHAALRLTGHPSEYDQVLNLGGMAALVVGTLLLAWDWLWIAMGGANQYFLGISHLVIDLWAVVIMTGGLKRLLGVPAWLGALLSVLSVPLSLPLAIMFMRAPL